MKALICDRIFDGERILEQHAVLIKDAVIDSVVPSKDLDKIETDKLEHLSDGILAPGFIDVQVNGGGGELFNNNLSADAVKIIGDAHRRYGTTSYLPTLISDSSKNMELALQAATDAIENKIETVLGIHFEGPFLNKVKRGAHSADIIRPIQAEDIQFLINDFPGIVLTTVAPDCVDTKMIEALCDAGVIVSLGHSNATYEQAMDALRAGATCFTHLYNAMSGMTAREPGVIGAALESKDSWCGLIVDKLHVHAASLNVALAAKPKGKCFLVSDAMATVGADSDEFIFFGEPLKVVDGRIVNRDGVLSGCHLDMASAVANSIEQLDVSAEEALKMASLYPAEFLNLSHELGRIKPGYKADIALLNDQWQVTQTWKAGVGSH